MGCFTDQVKLTRALVQNLDEAVKEVKLLGEHGEESSQKITELEALCQRLRDDTQRLEEEKATLEEMVVSRDELLMEIARERGLDRMDEDEGEEEEMDNEGDVAAPPAAASPPPASPADIPEEIHEEGNYISYGRIRYCLVVYTFPYLRDHLCSGTQCGHCIDRSKAFSLCQQRKVLDIAINKVSGALSIHMASLATRIVVVPVGVIVLLRLHNPPRRWTGTVGPSLPGFTVAPFVDSLLCYRIDQAA
jgi:hypothetical protein